MEFLKLFQNHTEYDAFVSGGTMVKPNVSHCVSENEVHYNPIEARLIVKYNVIDASQSTQLYHYFEGETTAALMFDKVEVDGTEVSIADLDTAEGYYQLSVGEHTVKYTLKDPTSIVNYIFSRCDRLTSVTIPNSVTSIGERAFDGCRGLISVTIPNSVTTIGDYAFYYCMGLTSLTIGNSVTSIGEGAFNGCGSLTSLTIPDSMTSIGDYAFGGCGGLTSVAIGNSVTYIGNHSFCDCISLNENSRNAIRAINPSASFSGCEVE